MLVEKYLLGELTGAEREQFEEHLFDSPSCAADLKAALTFAQGAREVLAAEAPVRTAVAEKTGSWFDWLLRPQWMGSALAACLLLAGYLNFFRVPALQQQLAEAHAPRIVSTLAMSSGAVRAESLPHVTAPKNGTFVISVDLALQPGVASYACSLYSPSGALVWQGSVPAAQAGEMLAVAIPAAATAAGKNTLAIASVRAGAPAGARPEDPTKHEFVLEIGN